MRRSFALRVLILAASVVALSLAAVPNRAAGASGTYSPAPIVQIVTPRGDILIKLFPKDAPITVANFEKLVNKGFYNGLVFHRITELSGPGTKIVQGGDGSRRGGAPAADIKGEFTANGVNNPLTHVVGAVAMARLGDEPNPQYNSANSQFYICVGANHFLDGKYAVFGMVIEGLDVADQLQQGDPMTSVTMVHH
jgi:peptidyl-prolyl cis-trans isomerase B (cyclophilin B)